MHVANTYILKPVQHQSLLAQYLLLIGCRHFLNQVNQLLARAFPQRVYREVVTQLPLIPQQILQERFRAIDATPSPNVIGAKPAHCASNSHHAAK